MSQDSHRAVAINVGANTTLPGFRGPIYPDGSFEYVPIPEREAIAADASVPTYGDLAPHLSMPLPEEILDRHVHLDPEFETYPRCERYTYGDEHGVKAGPISRLDPGERLYFYATLTTTVPAAGMASEADVTQSRESEEWIPPEWGAYLIGHFEVDRVVSGAAYAALDTNTRRAFTNNAHVKRESLDAEVFVSGTDESQLYNRAVPLSTPKSGGTANELVVALSNDSGDGPWWRRVLRYDVDAARELADIVDNRR